MRSIRSWPRGMLWIAALAAIFWAKLVRCSTCNTLATLLLADPNLSNAARLLQSSALLWGQLEDPNVTITLFVADNPGFFSVYNSNAWTMESASDKTGKSDLAVALYAAVPGHFNQSALVSAGTINTALGVQMSKDYPLKFVQLNDGMLTMERPWSVDALSRSSIAKKMDACNGILYQADRLLIPVGFSKDEMWERYANSSRSLEDRRALRCDGKDILSVMRSIQGSYSIRMSTMSIYGFKPLLQQANLSITLFVISDASIRPEMKSVGIDWQDALQYKEADVEVVLFSMLPRAYCPQELAQAGKVNTVLGQFRNNSQDYLLDFFLDPSGHLRLKGRSGVEGVVTDVLPACDSFIYLVDGLFSHFTPGKVRDEYMGNVWFDQPRMSIDQFPLALANDPIPLVATNYSSHLPRPLPSDPPRSLYCLPPHNGWNASYAQLYGYLDGTSVPPPADAPGSGSGTSVSGLSTGAIAGIALGAAAALALAAGLLVCTRRRGQRTRSHSGAAGGHGVPGVRGTGQPGVVAVANLASAKQIFLLPSRPGPQPEWLEPDITSGVMKSQGEEMLTMGPHSEGLGAAGAGFASASEDAPASSQQSQPSGDASSCASAGPMASPFTAFAVMGSVEPATAGFGPQPSGRGSYGLSELELERYGSTRQASTTVPSDGEAGMLPGPAGIGTAAPMADGQMYNLWSAVFSEYAAAAGAGRGPVPAAAPPAQGPATAEVALFKTTSLQKSGLFVVDLPMEDWELDPLEVDICTHADGALVELGSGGFGKVYRGLYKAETPVAVKFLHADNQREAVSKLRNEVLVLKECSHPNIVKFYGACLKSEWLMLVTEYMPGQDLSKSIKLPQFRWRFRGRRIALDVSRGMCYMHKSNMCHMDLKSSNVLLSADGTAKIADMGLSKIMPETYMATVAVGTFAWASPEQLMGLRCTNKTDVYSMGVLLWEVITGEVPLRGLLRPLKAPEECPAAVVDLVERCLEVNPKLRPTAQEVLNLLLAAQSQ